MNYTTDGAGGPALAGRTLGHLPVTYSILDAEALGALVEGAYAVAPPVSCELLLPSMNDSYLVKARGVRYILRVYRASWRSVDEIEYELSLLKHLDSAGVRVSVPVADREGRLLRALKAPEGTRHVTLFTFAEGEPLAWEDELQCRAAGRLLADIHTASGNFVPRGARVALDAVRLIDRPAALLEPFVAHRGEDAGFLAGFARRLRTRIDRLAGGLEWGLCHGDFAGGNVVVGEAGPVAFDFDLCGAGWRSFDLAAVQLVAVSRKNPGLWGGFLAGYQERRELAPADLAAIPLFCPVHRLWRLGLQAEHAQEWGVVRLSDSALDRELQSFRAWEAEDVTDA